MCGIYLKNKNNFDKIVIMTESYVPLTASSRKIVASARLPAAKPPPRRVPKAATDAVHTWHGAGSGAENAGIYPTFIAISWGK